MLLRATVLGAQGQKTQHVVDPSVGDAQQGGGAILVTEALDQGFLDQQPTRSRDQILAGELLLHDGF